MEKVQERLIELEEKGWSIQAVADAIETERESVSRWKSKGAPQSRSTLIHMALQHPLFQEEAPAKYQRHKDGA